MLIKSKEFSFFNLFLTILMFQYKRVLQIFKLCTQMFICVQACAYEHGCLRRQKSSDLLEQCELLEAGARSHSENQTQVLGKNNVCSSPLSILPSLWKEFLRW